MLFMYMFIHKNCHTDLHVNLTMSILLKLTFYCQVSHAYLCQDIEIILSVFFILDPFVTSYFFKDILHRNIWISFKST